MSAQTTFKDAIEDTLKTMQDLLYNFHKEQGTVQFVAWDLNACSDDESDAPEPVKPKRPSLDLNALPTEEELREEQALEKSMFEQYDASETLMMFSDLPEKNVPDRVEKKNKLDLLVSQIKKKSGGRKTRNSVKSQDWYKALGLHLARRNDFFEEPTIVF